MKQEPLFGEKKVNLHTELRYVCGIIAGDHHLDLLPTDVYCKKKYVCAVWWCRSTDTLYIIVVRRKNLLVFKSL